MDDVIVIESLEAYAETRAPRPRRRPAPWRIASGTARLIGSGAEWIFGLVTLVSGLSVLATLPIAQFLCMGYLLESSARVARSGRIRDGLIGVRKAARVGGVVLGVWVSLLPAALIEGLARSAEIIDPGGVGPRGWRVALGLVLILSGLHIAAACLRGGRLRSFLWPLTTPFWLVGRIRRGGLYAEARDGLWAFASGLRPLYYFRIGLVGFLGTLAWLIGPAGLIASGGRFPLLGFLGALSLGFVAASLPFLQVRYAVEGRARAFLGLGAVRDRFRRAPWAFAFALMALLLAAIPLYLLKIEAIPRDSAWLPGLIFIGFLAPARLLVGWAYARSARRERPRHWTLGLLGRVAILPATALYVLIVFLAQYTSWGGAASLFEQHAFLLPVPFMSF